MTTPDPARTAARKTPEWREIRCDLAPLTSLHWDARDFLADAIYNAVQRAIPPVPVPSNRPAALPSPTSDSEKHAEFMRHLERCRAEVATWPEWKQSILGGRPPAPPPASEAERPKCPECRDRGRVDVEDGRGNVVMDAACPRGCSAPPHATGDILDRAAAWVAEKYPMRGHATGELLRECIAEISTLRHAARVPLPQQQEDWRKDYMVEQASHGDWYVLACDPRFHRLTPDGWTTEAGLIDGTTGRGYFPSESAARAALAKAPRPTP